MTRHSNTFFPDPPELLLICGAADTHMEQKLSVVAGDSGKVEGELVGKRRGGCR